MNIYYKHQCYYRSYYTTKLEFLKNDHKVVLRVRLVYINLISIDLTNRVLSVCLSVNIVADDLFDFDIQYQVH